MRALVAIGLIAACSGNKAADKPPPEPEPEPEPTPTPAPAPAPAPTPTPTLADLKVPDPMSFDKATAADIKKRIDRAAIHAGKKEIEPALALLAELARARCAPCVPALDAAFADRRFEPLWTDPRFAELLTAGMPGIDDAAKMPAFWLVDIGCEDLYFDRETVDATELGCPTGTRKRSKKSKGRFIESVYCARGRKPHGPAVECSGPVPDAHNPEAVTNHGTYENGRKHGWWAIQPYVGGSLYTGRFHRGKKTGAWHYNESGYTRIQVYVAGREHGPRIEGHDISRWERGREIDSKPPTEP